MENFEQAYQQETEIHRRWQEIEDSAVRLKRQYESDPAVIRFIDYLRIIEKAFAKGRIKNWTNEQIREELVQSDIKDLSEQVGTIDKAIADALRDNFRKMHTTAHRIDEVAKELLEKYADRPEYHAFIYYLRDVWTAFFQSEEAHESALDFKARLVGVHMDLLASKDRVDREELNKIYEEFRQAVSSK